MNAYVLHIILGQIQDLSDNKIIQNCFFLLTSLYHAWTKCWIWESHSWEILTKGYLNIFLVKKSENWFEKITFWAEILTTFHRNLAFCPALLSIHRCIGIDNLTLLQVLYRTNYGHCSIAVASIQRLIIYYQSNDTPLNKLRSTLCMPQSYFVPATFSNTIIKSCWHFEWCYFDWGNFLHFV